MESIELTGRQLEDVKTLSKLDKETLLKLCETNRYVLDLCNDNDSLYKKITTPSN